MHILITAGGTREYIDPVRFISNASTGRMGYALARAAIKAGHKVTLISAPSALRQPKSAKVINVETAGEMFSAVKDNFDKVDCLIMAAAVSDYTPAKSSNIKIKKANTDLEIKLKPTKDILAWTGKNKKNKLVVGFALEDRNLKTNAEAKLRNKKLDMIVANRPAAIASERSSVYIKTPSTDWLELKNMKKESTALKIIRLIRGLC
jgi:phosphopantothenoylcysteine synthetase/decarboxylase